MGMLDGRVAIVTGAGRGIGKASALMLAGHGAALVVNDYDAEPAEATAAEIIAASGGRAVCVPGDVTAADFGERITRAALEAFGDVHIVVNAAGYSWDTMFHKMTDEQWEAMLAVHLTASYRLLRALASYFRDKPRQEMASGQRVMRKVVNIMSITGEHGNYGQANYAAAKAGLIGLTKSLAKEWAQFNVCCNVASFGLISTRLNDEKESGEKALGKVSLGIPKALRDQMIPQIPMGRMGTTEEAAGAVFFLASPLSDYVTGHVLTVDGGLGM